MKLIDTNKVNIKAIIDDEDFNRLSTLKISVTNSKCLFVYLRSENKIVPLANKVMQKYNCIFDHKDRNPLNNQKTNLREATHSQNGANKVKLKGTSSKYKGVYRDRKNHRWVSQIRINGKQTRLKSFIKEEDAAKFYDSYAIKIFGEFAVLNFPSVQ